MSSTNLPTPKTIVITGANKDLGLELVKALLKLGPEVLVATYRNPARSKELLELAVLDPRLHAIQLDVRQDCMYCSIFKQVAELVGDNGLNLLINNAGIFTESQTLCDLDKKGFMEFYEVNAIAPLMLAKELLPLMLKASECLETACEPMSLSKAVIVNITSGYGSIHHNNEGKYYYTRCCRAALNAATKSLAIDLKDKNVLVCGVSPGLVHTEEFGAISPPSVEESAAEIVRVLQRLDDTKTGLFLDFSGVPIPW